MHTKTAHTAMVALLMALLLCQARAQAGVYIRGEPTDHVTLGAAVDHAVHGDVIELGPGTYAAEDLPIVVGVDVTLIGTHGSAMTTLHNPEDHYAGDLIQVNGATVSVQGITLSSDGPARGIDMDGGGLAALDLVAVGLGGDFPGGAIRTRRGPLTVAGCAFVGNAGRSGGAIDSGGPLSVDDTVFSNNRGSAEGGAVRAHRDVVLSSVRFTNNTAGLDGGAAYIDGVATITAVVLDGNVERAGAMHGGGLVVQP